MPSLPPGTASRMAVSVWTMWRWVCSQPLGIPVVPPMHSQAASASRSSAIRSSGACSSSRSKSPTRASAARSSTPGESPMEPGVGPGHHRHEDDGRAAGSGGCHLPKRRGQARLPRPPKALGTGSHHPASIGTYPKHRSYLLFSPLSSPSVNLHTSCPDRSPRPTWTPRSGTAAGGFEQECPS